MSNVAAKKKPKKKPKTKVAKVIYFVAARDKSRAPSSPTSAQHALRLLHRAEHALPAPGRAIDKESRAAVSAAKACVGEAFVALESLYSMLNGESPDGLTFTHLPLADLGALRAAYTEWCARARAVKLMVNAWEDRLAMSERTPAIVINLADVRRGLKVAATTGDRLVRVGETLVSSEDPSERDGLEVKPGDVEEDFDCRRAL